MREKLTNNLFLKLISIVVAFIVWLVVIDISDPPVTMTKIVPLQIKGESVISSAGKAYTLNSGNVVTVSYKVRTKDKRKISADDFKASIDLAQLYDVTGAVPVNVEVLDKHNYIIGSPSVSPSVISVSTEDIQRKEFKLSAKIKGYAGEGYSVGNILLEPGNVYLNGPVSIIGRVSSIGVEIDVSGASSDIHGDAKPIFYDANGNKINIDDPDVYFDKDDIKYKVSILQGKLININFNTSGEVAKGYRFIGMDTSTKSISVTGSSKDLLDLNSVDIPSNILNLNNLSSNKTINFDISELLPANVKVSGNSQISITLKVEPLIKKNFILGLNDISVEGEKENYQYKINPEKINIIVSGIEGDLNSLNIKNLNAKLDVSAFTKGEHAGSLKFNLPKSLDIDSYTPFNISISEKNDKDVSINKESSIKKHNSSKEIPSKEISSKEIPSKEIQNKETGTTQEGIKENIDDEAKQE